VKRRIAFFDFDGTVTTKDTLLEFIKYAKGTGAFYRGFLLYSPFLVAYKLKIISNQLAKERVLRHFFGKMSQSAFNHLCKAFASDVVPSLIRPKALVEIEKLKQVGAEVVIVSASAENWVSIWCQNIGVKWIATQLEICDDALSGKILGKNCYGDEKVRRIKETYDLKSYDEIYCYGDTNGDKPMLALATISFYKPFR
jgi:HAD superfamily hydrolase (TIGR01490 family)